MQELLLQQQRRFNAGCVDRVMPVLFEKSGRHAGQLVGRTPYLQPVHAEASEASIGQLLPVTIRAVLGNSLAGEIENDVAEGRTAA